MGGVASEPGSGAGGQVNDQLLGEISYLLGVAKPGAL